LKIENLTALGSLSFFCPSEQLSDSLPNFNLLSKV